MIQRNEADVPEMLTEPGKWLDGHTSLLKGTSETQYFRMRLHHDGNRNPDDANGRFAGIREGRRR
jgi:hypothetical protein